MPQEKARRQKAKFKVMAVSGICISGCAAAASALFLITHQPALSSCRMPRAQSLCATEPTCGQLSSRVQSLYSLELQSIPLEPSSHHVSHPPLPLMQIHLCDCCHRIVNTVSFSKAACSSVSIHEAPCARPQMHFRDRRRSAEARSADALHSYHVAPLFIAAAPGNPKSRSLLHCGKAQVEDHAQRDR